METDAIWRRVIEAMYGNEWWLVQKTVSSAYGVSLWKIIRSGWLNFSKLLRYDVGDGTRVNFWKHVWSGDCILKEAFPEFYCISRARDSSTVKVMCLSDGRIHWDVQFCRIVHDWELESLALFMDIVLFVCAGSWFVGSQQWVEVLRFKDFIFLYTLLLSYLSQGKWCANRRFLQGYLSFHDLLL